MSTIDHVTLEVADQQAAESFYSTTFGARVPLRLRASDATSTGFRGFTLSLVVPQPADVDLLMDDALAAGATALKPAAKSLWGYGGAVAAPDGTVWTIASAAKKGSGDATGHIQDVVLQLGVADVPASTAFYVERGLTVATRYGRRYVELDTGPVTLTLNKRAALAKAAGMPADGTGSHRLSVASAAGPFTDPDGFVWEADSA